MDTTPSHTALPGQYEGPWHWGRRSLVASAPRGGWRRTSHACVQSARFRRPDDAADAEHVRGAMLASGTRFGTADIVKNICASRRDRAGRGRARVRPTQFDGDDEDMLRRFFRRPLRTGSRESPQMPQMRKQRGQLGVIVTQDGIARRITTSSIRPTRCVSN